MELIPDVDRRERKTKKKRKTYGAQANGGEEEEVFSRQARSIEVRGAGDGSKIKNIENTGSTREWGRISSDCVRIA